MTARRVIPLQVADPWRQPFGNASIDRCWAPGAVSTIVGENGGGRAEEDGDV
jgi:hypothetical protein